MSEHVKKYFQASIAIRKTLLHNDYFFSQITLFVQTSTRTQSPTNAVVYNSDAQLGPPMSIKTQLWQRRPTLCQKLRLVQVQISLAWIAIKVGSHAKLIRVLTFAMAGADTAGASRTR